MNEVEYLARVLRMVEDSIAAPPKKLCDACLQRRISDELRKRPARMGEFRAQNPKKEE